MQEVYTNWVIDETKSSHFSDKPLTKRFEKILSDFANAPTKSIPNTFRTWGESLAAYRFFNNEDVNEHKILSSHQMATIERIKKKSIVLIPQDTNV
jgi:hypothetical protein